LTAFRPDGSLTQLLAALLSTDYGITEAVALMVLVPTPTI
jgi:hypothetical protein